MYVLNITTMVDNKIVSDWLKWQKEHHIPSMMKTGNFTDFRFHQLLEQDESDGKTFVLQLVAPSRKDYYDFINTHERTLREACFIKWGEDYAEFRSLLQNID